MDEAGYAARIAEIRTRFSKRLDTEITATGAALEELTGSSEDVACAVAVVYRRFHSVCGIGGTLGFGETGKAARRLDAILVGPYRDHRGLNRDEIDRLREGLESIRITSRTESAESARKELAS